jgi:hypothetical protein
MTLDDIRGIKELPILDETALAMVFEECADNPEVAAAGEEFLFAQDRLWAAYENEVFPEVIPEVPGE